MQDSYQQSLRLIGEVRTPAMADPDIVLRLPTFRAALRYAINHSGLDQESIATALGINPGDFSRMVREPKHENARLRVLPPEKLAHFASITGSYVALQWLSSQVGMEPASMRETRIQRLERELAAERQRAAA